MGALFVVLQLNFTIETNWQQETKILKKSGYLGTFHCSKSRKLHTQLQPWKKTLAIIENHTGKAT